MKKHFKSYKHLGLPGGANELKSFTEGFIVSSEGQYKYPGMNTMIPNANGRITMSKVGYPVLGIDDLGNSIMMQPGGEYQFPGNDVYEIPMAQDGKSINPIEADLISKVIMNRNRGVDFVDRAFALGENPGTPLFNVPDDEQFGQTMSHKMAYGTDDSGQTYMFPTVLNPNDEAIQVKRCLCLVRRWQRPFC